MGNNISIKNFRRWISLGDKLMFLGIPLLFTLMATGAALTPQDWSLPAIIMVSGIVLVSWVFGIGVLVKKMFTKPDIMIENGPFIWTNNLPVVKHRVEDAIMYFKSEALRRKLATIEQLEHMFDCLRVEYVKNPIKYTNKVKSGFAFGIQYAGSYNIKVVWRNEVGKDAFFHECAHVLRNVSFGLDPDYKHTDKPIWDFVDEITKNYRVNKE